MSDDEFEEKKPQHKAKPAARKEKYDALVMVIDCGKTMNEVEDARSHFSMAKEAADWIISRKIFTQSKDRISIVLFGSEETKNNLDIPHVYVQDEVLSRVSFDHLRFLNREVNNNCKVVGNAVDALVVATDFLHHQTDGDAAVKSKNILLFTNDLAKSTSRKTEVSAVINGINAMEATLVAIGVDSDSATGDKADSSVLNIVKRTDGINYGFSRAIRKNWEIAPGVRLPLAMYTKAVMAKNPLKSVLVNEEGVEMHRQTRFLSTSKNVSAAAESDAELDDLEDEEKRIQVYYFGDTKVPIGEDDESRYNRHNFNEGEQRGCMKLIQFTKRENIKECYFIGRNSFVVVPGWEKKTSERDLEAMRTTLSLISAMLENDVVAICRYAPDAAKHLQLMALIPHRDEELDFVYLQALRLPFAEDMRPFNFVNVSESCPKPNHKQVNLIDELIDVMQFNAESGLMEAECVLNPFFQRQCTAMKLKALNDIKSGDDSKIADLIAP
ncbi:Ku70/Ku80 beta-barrel domain protein, partial [Cooperia oncophora]